MFSVFGSSDLFTSVLLLVSRGGAADQWDPANPGPVSEEPLTVLTAELVAELAKECKLFIQKYVALLCNVTLILWAVPIGCP